MGMTIEGKEDVVKKLISSFILPAMLACVGCGDKDPVSSTVDGIGTWVWEQTSGPSGGRYTSILSLSVDADGVDRKTAVAWKSTAAATYQWMEIPAFTRNATKRVSAKHKGYMTDTGLICYHQRIGSADAIAGHPLQGQLVETWSAMEIVKTVRAWSTQRGWTAGGSVPFGRASHRSGWPTD